jgi:hypothetical protein
MEDMVAEGCHPTKLLGEPNLIPTQSIVFPSSSVALVQEMTSKLKSKQNLLYKHDLSLNY